MDRCGHVVIEVINKTVPYRPLFAAKAGDVGYDLYVQVRPQDQTWLDRFVSWFLREPVYVLAPLVGMRLLSTAIWVSMPDEIWCRIRARSSTMRKKMQVLGGTIDSGYQGELFTHLHNFGFRFRLIRHGERYAQAVFHYAVRPFCRQVRVFSHTSLRGDTGFGSTGS